MTDAVFTMGKEIDLKEEMKRTLATPRLPANLMLKIMFLTFDVLYGKARSLPKVMVLEILARYPYWAWEHGAYRLLSKWHCGTRPHLFTPRPAQRIRAPVRILPVAARCHVVGLLRGEGRRWRT